MYYRGRGAYHFSVLVLSIFAGLVSFASGAHAYIDVTVMPETVVRGGTANVISVFTGSYPATCTVKNVTNNITLGTYVLNSSNDSNQNYAITNIQSDKVVSLTCTDSTGKYEDTDTVTVSDTGSSNFQVNQYSSESVVVPGGTTKVESWSTSGIFPYQCTYTDSSGFRKDLTITSGNKGPANPQSYVYERTLTLQTTTTYTTDCTDAAGVRKSSSVKVEVSNLPVLKLLSSVSDLPDGGGDVQLTVDVELATSCRTSDGTSAWQSESFPGSMYDGVSYATPRYSINKTTTFSIECTNAAGSSGKKSVSIYVGNKCGNGVIDEDVNEQCDNGKDGNRDTCPTTCTTRCQAYYCTSSTVNFTSKFTGASNDIEMCVGGDGERDDVHIKPGATVTYTWDAKNAVTCSHDAGDELDAPFAKCFPPVIPGGGPVSVPVKGSCSITVPSDAPQGTVFQYTMQCDDGAAPKNVADSFRVADVSGSDATCGNDTGKGNANIEILSFSASPQTVPFGYTGDLTFSWKTEVKNNNEGFTPECTLGYGTDASWNPLTPVIKGLNKSTTLSVSQITQRAGSGGSGAKFMGLNCRIPVDIYHSDDNSETNEVIIYFATDPSAAPVAKLAFGSSGDSNSDKTAQVAPNKSVSVYLQTGGAERCEYTLTGATTYAKTFTPMKAGETSLQHAFTGDTLITLECFNGTLSTKDTIAVTINTGTPTDDGSGGGSGGPSPVDNSTCSQGTPKASCNDATEVVVGKTKDGTGVCCLARTGSEATLYTIPISNPLAFNTVDELLTSLPPSGASSKPSSSSSLLS